MNLNGRAVRWFDAERGAHQRGVVITESPHRRYIIRDSFDPAKITFLPREGFRLVLPRPLQGQIDSCEYDTRHRPLIWLIFKFQDGSKAEFTFTDPIAAELLTEFKLQVRLCGSYSTLQYTELDEAAYKMHQEIQAANEKSQAQVDKLLPRHGLRGGYT